MSLIIIKKCEYGTQIHSSLHLVQKHSLLYLVSRLRGNKKHAYECCPICLDELTNFTILTTYCYSHYFCCDCVTLFNKSNDTCPMCDSH